MMPVQQAGTLEHEAEGTTFHSWPAAPLPTSLRPLCLALPFILDRSHLRQHWQHAALDEVSEVPRF